jgi:peptide/nickel transport system ATP-binding protein
MAMIFQDALAALHPYYTVGNQIAEAYTVHNKVSKKVALDRAIEMLDRVGIPEPQKRVHDHPHQFSGGMRQRAMIAMALSCNPSLLIADRTSSDSRTSSRSSKGVRNFNYFDYSRPWCCCRNGR